MNHDWQTLPAAGDGPVAIALNRSLCAEASFTCDQVALLAHARHPLPTPPTAVLVGSTSAWRAPISLQAGNIPAGPVTIRGWIVPGGGMSRPIGPVFYNVTPAAIRESVIELGGLAVRDPDSGSGTRLVVLLQSFIAAEVSATITIDAPDAPVRIRSHWGLHDDLGATPERDVLVLNWPELVVVGRQTRHQAVAVVAAQGGTRLAEVPPRLRGRPTLSIAQARPIARACAELTQRMQVGAEFDVAIRTEVAQLLVCRRL